MKLLIKKIEGLELPRQATTSDAGYDISAVSDPIIVAEKEDIIAPELLDDKPTYYRRIKYIEYLTGLYWAPEQEIKNKIIDVTYIHGMASAQVITVPKVNSYHVELFPRSSISKYQLTLANSIGLIDAGYTGEIRFRFKYHFAPADLVPRRNEKGDYELVGSVNPSAIYGKGDAIGQLVARKTIPVEIRLVDELPTSERAAGGFGSTDKK
jgi:dUTPase